MKKLLFKSMGFIIAGIFIIIFLVSGKMYALSGAAANAGLSSTDINTQNNTNAATQDIGSTSSEPQIKIGDRLDIPGLNLKANTYIDDMKYADVTGDGINDTIILAGVKETPDGIYSLNFTIIVLDGANKQYSSIPAGDSGGYSGELFIGDFNGDKVPDIMTGAATGGSGGTYYYSLVTFAGGKPAILVNQEDMSRGAGFKGQLKDGYKVEITNAELNKNFSIDISERKKEYIDNMIYNAEGKLLQGVEISVDGFQQLEPVDYDNDGVYELKGVQAIWGFTHVNTIAIADTLWKLEDGILKLKSVELSPIQ